MQLDRQVFSIFVSRLLDGDSSKTMGDSSFSACGSYEISSVALNSLIESSTLLKLLLISHLYIWSSPIKLELNCGLLPLVSQVCYMSLNEGMLCRSSQFHDSAFLLLNFEGGLSMNDFIVAAKIDLIKTSDLVPKKRVWA